MREEVLTFFNTIKEREHILQLIQNTNFSLALKNGNESVSVAFMNGEIFLENLLPSYEISGDILQLLTGEEPLRTLVKKGIIKITAPFRTILMLESIFYLAKGKIIQII